MRPFASWFRSIRPSTNAFASYPVLAFLTDQQRYEEVSLKKKKLALKDRIEAIRRDRRTRLRAVRQAARRRGDPRARARTRAQTVTNRQARSRSPRRRPHRQLPCPSIVPRGRSWRRQQCRPSSWLSAPAAALVLLLLPVGIALFFRDPERSDPDRAAPGARARGWPRDRRRGGEPCRSPAGLLEAGDDLSGAAATFISTARPSPGRVTASGIRAGDVQTGVPARCPCQRALRDLDRGGRANGRIPSGGRDCWLGVSSPASRRATGWPRVTESA